MRVANTGIVISWVIDDFGNASLLDNDISWDHAFYFVYGYYPI